MKLWAMLKDWRGFLACFRIRCPKCGRFYYVPSELASMGERRCQCDER
jgi:uncharacterized OB-fold protein